MRKGIIALFTLLILAGSVSAVALANVNYSVGARGGEVTSLAGEKEFYYTSIGFKAGGRIRGTPGYEGEPELWGSGAVNVRAIQRVLNEDTGRYETERFILNLELKPSAVKRTIRR